VARHRDGLALLRDVHRLAGGDIAEERDLDAGLAGQIQRF